MRDSQPLAKTLPRGTRSSGALLSVDIRRAAFLFLSLALVLSGCATGLQRASSPESVGVSSERLKDMSAAFEAGVDKKEIPGAVVMLARNGKIAYFESFGYLDREAAVPMTRDAIFRIASMTKPVTSVAAMMLVEEGRLSLSDPVSKYLPEFNGVKIGIEKKSTSGVAELVLEDPKREMTIIDLLRHTSGLTYGIFGKSLVKDRYKAANLYDPNQSLAAMVTKLAKLPLQNEPGTTWDYSMSTDVLGRVIEVISGTELDVFFSKRIFIPLRMTDTAFRLDDPTKIARIAQLQANPATGKRFPAPDPTKTRWLSGAGGLVSTVSDYARFCQMLLNGGELDGVRLLSRKTVEQMTSNQRPSGTKVVNLGPGAFDVRPEAGMGFGLGFGVRIADGQSSYPGSVGDYSWTGLWGTQFWVDPKNGMFAIMMMQLPPPSPEYPLPGIYYVKMRNLAYKALLKAD